MATKAEIVSMVQAVIDDNLQNFGSIRNRLKAIVKEGQAGKPVGRPPKAKPNKMAPSLIAEPKEAPDPTPQPEGGEWTPDDIQD